MIAYKAFDAGLQCRGYQFHMGRNTTGKANCRENGFHCAANPLDCLSYYSDMEHSEYYIVDAGGDIDEDDVDSKISCTQLTILKKMDLWEFTAHALAYLFDHPKMAWNQHVHREYGEAHNGFIIVRGKNPKAKGKNGDILALARENTDGTTIKTITMAQVDGEKLIENVWYGVDLLPCGE